MPASAIRDGVRSYMAVYKNLVRDTEPDPKNREEAARDWRKLCRRRVAEEVAKNAGTLRANTGRLCSASSTALAGLHYRAKMDQRVEAFPGDVRRSKTDAIRQAVRASLAYCEAIFRT